MFSGNSRVQAQGSIDAGKAASFLDCENGDPFWHHFREAFSATGPLSPATASLAYLKWKEWEDFIDGMDAASLFDGRIFVPLAGEWHPDGSAYYTQIREKRDWVTALQKSQWQGLFGSPPAWSSDNLVGFMACPVGFALVQYVIFLVHKMRSNLPEDAARLNLESMLFAFVSILDSNFDHLESSNWNVSSFDLAVNLNLEDPHFYASYRDFIEEGEGKSENAIMFAESSFQCDRDDRDGFQFGKIRVALVGEHGPSNLEHLASLQAAAGRMELEAGHFFAYLWQFEKLSEFSAFQSSLRITWDAFWGEPLTESAGRDKLTSRPLWKVHEALWALKEFARRDVFLRSFVTGKVASLFLVVWPGAPSSVLAPSSDARSP